MYLMRLLCCGPSRCGIITSLCLLVLQRDRAGLQRRGPAGASPAAVTKQVSGSLEMIHLLDRLNMHWMDTLTLALPTHCQFPYGEAGSSLCADTRVGYAHEI